VISRSGELMLFLLHVLLASAERKRESRQNEEHSGQGSETRGYRAATATTTGFVPPPAVLPVPHWLMT